MSEDTDLLRRYAESKSEAAFSELVRRRLGLVYSVALRQTRDAHRAEDAAQMVFSSLARNASSLARRNVLVGWFYRAAHNAALDLVRSEISRNTREQEAYVMQDTSTPATPAVDWDRVRPLLDEALNELDEADRDAVLLRFFEGGKYAEIGRALRIPENTARMRVERALDKLHGLLTRRGIASTGVALALALAQQGAAALPPGLATSIIETARSGPATAIGTQAGLLRSLLTPKTIGVGTAIVAALGIGLMISHEPRPALLAVTPAPPVPADATPIPGTPTAPGSSSRGQESAARTGQRNLPEPSGTVPPAVTLASQLTSQQRSAIRNNLSMIAAARDYFLKLNQRLPDSLEDIVGETGPIRTLKPVTDEDYHSVKLDGKNIGVQLSDGSEIVLSTDGPVAKGPPTLAEAKEWQSALASYVQMRPPGGAPRLPVKPADAAAGLTGLQFTGVMAAGAGPVFVLADDTGTAWLKLGQQFGAYAIKEYHADEETLILAGPDASFALKLRTATVASSFTAETEIAYLASQEILTREGWALENVSIQKPEYLKANGKTPARWVDAVHQVLERDDRHIVMGDTVALEFDERGKLLHYKNLGIMHPPGKQ